MVGEITDVATFIPILEYAPTLIFLLLFHLITMRYFRRLDDRFHNTLGNTFQNRDDWTDRQYQSLAVILANPDIPERLKDDILHTSFPSYFPRPPTWVEVQEQQQTNAQLLAVTNN